MKYVAWSGGFDSTYVVMKHVLNNETVQPIFLEEDEILDARSLRTIEFFRNIFPNNINKPECFNKNYFKRKKIEEIAKTLEKYEEKIIETHDTYFSSINFHCEAMKWKYRLIDSHNNSHYCYHPHPKRFETLLKYYWPIFHGTDKFVSKKKDSCYTVTAGGYQKNKFIPLISLSQELEIEIQIGIHAMSFVLSEPLKKWIGIDQNHKIIQRKSYTELQILDKMSFPLIHLTKADIAKILSDQDIELLKLIVENGSSCLEKNKKTNYCGKCFSCFNLRNSNVFNYLNLHKLRNFNH